MSKSEIFDSFIKIAQEKGMIFNDSSEAKKKLEQTGRADSLDISAIEALYGVKPDSPKAMDYKSNIMEVAHPNSVVVSPAYDKLNGLVENNIERQNIMLRLVNKSPDGLLVQRKYAEQELILSLVRIANDLDNKNKEQLRTLADSCLQQVNAQFQKKAWALPVILLVGATIGALWAHQHLPNVMEGVEADYQRLDAACEKVVNSSVSWGLGHEYDNAIKEDVNGLQERLKEIKDTYDGLLDVLRELEQPRNRKDLLRIAKSSTTHSVLEAYNKFNNLFTNVKSYLDTVEKNFTSDFYKKRHTVNTGAISSGLESAHLSGGGTSLIGDPLQDVANAIPTFNKSVEEILITLRKAKERQNSFVRDASAVSNKGTSSAPPLFHTPNASQEGSVSPESSSPVSAIHDRANEAFSGLTSLVGK